MASGDLINSNPDFHTINGMEMLNAKLGEKQVAALWQEFMRRYPAYRDINHAWTDFERWLDDLNTAVKRITGVLR